MIIALLDDDDDDSEVEEITPCKQPESPCKLPLSSLRAQVKEATDAIAKAKKDLAIAQKKKNAFCSLRRSRVSVFRNPGTDANILSSILAMH